VAHGPSWTNGNQRLGLASRADILRYALAQGWLQADQDPQ
jgi:hypothetical protein